MVGLFFKERPEQQQDQGSVNAAYKEMEWHGPVKGREQKLHQYVDALSVL